MLGRRRYAMSAIGTKQTSACVACICPLSGVKRTSSDTEGQCLLLTQSGHPFQKAGERSPAEAGRRVERIYLRTLRLPANSLPLSEIISSSTVAPSFRVLEPVALERRDVHEHVLATALRLNEAVPFCWIEPFNGTSSHSTLHRMFPGKIAGRSDLTLRVGPRQCPLVAQSRHQTMSAPDVRFFEWGKADIAIEQS